MSELEHWYQVNEQHLTVQLNWLHLRLARLIKATPPATISTTSCTLFGRSKSVATAPPTTAPIPTETEIEEARALAVQAENQALLPALPLLGRRLGLSRFEQAVLFLCAAMELDTRIPVQCAQAQADPNRPYPTFALALALFEQPSWDILSPERPLRYWRLIEINPAASQPLTVSALRADERIVNYLKGLNYLDERLAPWVVPLLPAAMTVPLPPSQQAVVETVLAHIASATTASRSAPIIALIGADNASKRLIVQQVAQQLGLNVYRLPIAGLPTSITELETLARLWERECLLLPLALLWEVDEADQALQHTAMQHFLSRSSGLVFLATRTLRQDLGRTPVVIEVHKPTSAEQHAAWTTVLGSPADAAELSSQFDLDCSSIHELGQQWTGETVYLEHVWAACLSRSRPKLETLAQRIVVKATWQDIVLPSLELALLHQIVAQVRQRSTVYEDWGFGAKMNRGLGINALFAGDSGTGKTMAAEVIAHALQLDLYRIDLSAVVSKYIGETEKNLRRLFDAAEEGGAILFFDEADALFGKRSEVKDSHDRYANIEINYLLQRIETYRGLAILATNMKSALDTAFQRRLRFIVHFPFPGVAERKSMWQKVFPAATPTEGLLFDRLARLNMTGGSIHNAALNAAFMAAQAGVAVSMPLVLAAARAEFRKEDKPVNEADFRWQAEEVT